MNWEQLKKSVNKIINTPPSFTYYSPEEKKRLTQSISDKRITREDYTKEELDYMASNSSWFNDSEAN